ncbi:MAG TPA: hypothetical protein VLV81_05765 [Acidimicrobiia bacterium]|nr:hypothetical protein [Acidimicrobiia bacterium]
MSDPPPSAYSTLPSEGPYETRLGSALITLVEPAEGHDHAYNRWYEDDHYYSGAMAMPWMFAGRRWVATRDLQALRYPDPSPIAEPLNAGKYLATYWITDGRYEDHLRWTVATNQRLLPDGRIYLDRSHVYTSFQQYTGAVYRDPTGPRDIHALDHPYQGLVLEVIDAPPGTRRADLDQWLRVEYLPDRLRGSRAAMTLFFEPIPLPADRMSYVDDVPGLERRITLLTLTDEPAADTWADTFSSTGAAVARAGVGTVELAAPFLPTIPGTDTYVDWLR